MIASLTLQQDWWNTELQELEELNAIESAVPKDLMAFQCRFTLFSEDNDTPDSF